MLHAFSLLATTSSNFILVSLLLLVARLQAASGQACGAVEFGSVSGLAGKVRDLQDDSKGCLEEQPRERERSIMVDNTPPFEARCSLSASEKKLACLLGVWVWGSIPRTPAQNSTPGTTTPCALD